MSQHEADPAATDGPTNALLPALLSYLVPGLGQIVQGRIGKGILFLVCLYALFFYGLYLGRWQNVYIDNMKTDNPFGRERQPSFTDTVVSRARFLGQMWIGVAAWPAFYQYWQASAPANGAPNDDGVPQVRFDEKKPEPNFLGRVMRQPTEREMSDFLRDSNKTPDLGWVYTVIAGVLNILVIYDAYAGPAFPLRRQTPVNAPSVSQEVASV